MRSRRNNDSESTWARTILSKSSDACITIDGAASPGEHIVGPHFDALFALVEPATIRELRIRNVASLGDSMNHVVRLIIGQPGLKTIELSRCGLKNDHAKSIANTLASCLSLAKLDLRDNGILVTGARELARKIRGHEGLRTVCLDGNPVGESGAKELLSMLESNRTLLSLHLDGISSEIMDRIRAINRARQREDDNEALNEASEPQPTLSQDSAPDPALASDAESDETEPAVSEDSESDDGQSPPDESPARPAPEPNRQVQPHTNDADEQSDSTESSDAATGGEHRSFLYPEDVKELRHLEDTAAHQIPGKTWIKYFKNNNNGVIPPLCPCKPFNRNCTSRPSDGAHVLVALADGTRIFGITPTCSDCNTKKKARPTPPFRNDMAIPVMTIYDNENCTFPGKILAKVDGIHGYLDIFEYSRPMADESRSNAKGRRRKLVLRGPIMVDGKKMVVDSEYDDLDDLLFTLVVERAEKNLSFTEQNHKPKILEIQEGWGGRSDGTVASRR